MSKEKANERINSRINPVSAKSRSHTGLIIAVSAVIICILVGTILYIVLGKDNTTQYNVVVTPDNVEQMINQLNKADYTPIGSYEVSMSTEWTFSDGKSASTNAYVENRITNQNNVFFTITPADDTSNEIYRSPYLAVGSHLKDIKLDKALSAGVHKCVLTYHLVDSNNNEMSSVSVSMTITIEK